MLSTGYLMDRYGRKTSLIYCSVLPITSWVLILFATCPLHLHCARLLGGLWVGIITTVAPMYTGEISEPNIRGGLGNVFSLLTYVGTLFVFIIGPYVSYESLAIIAGMVPIYFLIMLLLMPESPYYLLMKENKVKARESLRWLRGDIEDDKLEQEVTEMEKLVFDKVMQGKSSFKDIFRTQANRKAFLIVQLYALFVKFGGIGIIMAFSSMTLPKTAFKSFGPQECAIVLASTWVVSSTISILLVDRIGRKILLTSTSLGCCLTMFVTGLWFYLNTQTSFKVDDISYVPFVCLVLHGMLYALGLGPIGTAIKGELLSANIRGSASAATTVTYALASVFLNQIYLPVTDHIGVFANFWFYSLNCLICALFTIFVFFETKGKTLQEIQNKLAKRKPVCNEIPNYMQKKMSAEIQI